MMRRLSKYPKRCSSQTQTVGNIISLTIFQGKVNMTPADKDGNVNSYGKKKHKHKKGKHEDV